MIVRANSGVRVMERRENLYAPHRCPHLALLKAEPEKSAARGIEGTAIELSSEPFRIRRSLALDHARDLDLLRELESKSTSMIKSKNRPPMLNPLTS